MGCQHIDLPLRFCHLATLLATRARCFHLAAHARRTPAARYLDAASINARRTIILIRAATATVKADTARRAPRAAALPLRSARRATLLNARLSRCWMRWLIYLSVASEGTRGNLICRAYPLSALPSLTATAASHRRPIATPYHCPHKRFPACHLPRASPNAHSREDDEGVT